MVLKNTKRKGIKGVGHSEQDPAQLILHLERKVLRTDLSLKSNKKTKPMLIQFKKGPASRLHAKQAAELGNFGQVVLASES